MKNIFLIFFVLFNMQKTNAFEIEYIYLKNGQIVDVKNESFDITIDQIKLLEIKTTDDNKIITPRSLKKIMDANNEARATSSGELGGGG